MKVIDNQLNSCVYNQENSRAQAPSASFGAKPVNKNGENKDTFTKKAEKEIKENWLFSAMRNTFGIENPKKTLTSIGLAVLTTVGIAYMGNKMTDCSAKFGNKVDQAVSGSKIYNGIANFFTNVKEKLTNFVNNHSATARDISKTFKERHAVQKIDGMRGYGHGFTSIFSLTPPDILSKIFGKETGKYAAIKGVFESHKSAVLALQQLRKTGGSAEAVKAAQETLKFTKAALDEAVKKAGAKTAGELILSARKGISGALEPLIGTGKAARELAGNILGVTSAGSNVKFCENFSDAMRQHLGCGNDHGKFIDKLIQLKKTGKCLDAAGKEVDASKFIDVVMSDGKFSPISNWWPVNFIRKCVSAVTGKPSKIGLGNLPDALLKQNVVNGKTADTFIGRLVQKSIIVPAESISNFVNDKSGLGFFLCSLFLKPLFDNLQDAPKGKRTAIAADDLAGTMGSIAVTTPLAIGTTYALATLGNMEGTTLKGKILKNIGKFFNMGLDKYAKDGSKISNTSRMAGIAGGALRFWLIMVTFNKLFGRPVKKVINKIFGDPGNGADLRRHSSINGSTQKMTAEAAAQKQQTKPQIQPQQTLKQQPAPAAAASGSPNQTERAYTPASGRIRRNTNIIEQRTHAPANNSPYLFKNSVIASSNLNGAAENSVKKQRYIPSVQVDNSYIIEEQKKTNEKVNKILSRTDAKISSLARQIQA